jgi:hypothetical protein
MRTHLIRKTIPWRLAALLVAAGCGDDSDEGSGGEGVGTGQAAAAEAAGADSEYCDVAIEWAIHELTPVDASDPAAFRQYWAEHTDFEERALATTPEHLKADWELKMRAEDETIDVVLEEYGYDIGRIMEVGTPEEQATFEAPPEVAAAQSRIATYESEVCGSAFPEPADVSYAGEEPGPYCDLVGVQQEEANGAIASGDPAQIEAFVVGQAESAPAIVDAAPEVIANDVAAVSEWQLNEQSDVLEAHGWDAAAVMRDGSAQDRYDFNLADEAIREQFARVVAYEQQVCGA